MQLLWSQTELTSALSFLTPLPLPGCLQLEQSPGLLPATSPPPALLHTAASIIFLKYGCQHADSPLQFYIALRIRSKTLNKVLKTLRPFPAPFLDLHFFLCLCYLLSLRGRGTFSISVLLEPSSAPKLQISSPCLVFQ